MRKLVFILVLIASAGVQLPADGPVKAINTDESGLALKGFDAVAYFVDGKAVAGLPQFEHQWSGARWRFSTAAHRDRFAQSPETYAPQFGGYCAWAVSRNYTADIDPEAFEIVGGKLYLNYSKLVQLRWKMSREENIRKGEQNWPRLVR
jgi:hypothetical protein